MAKRANPFIEDFIPQSKIHVGLKQFNNNEYRLKEVYEKTLDMLFKGAKKAIGNDIGSGCDTNTVRKDKMRQLFIAKDGSLLHSGNIVENRPEVKHCSCGSASSSQCTYCEKVLCGNCQHSCSLCNLLYCNQCMLLGQKIHSNLSEKPNLDNVMLMSKVARDNLSLATQHYCAGCIASSHYTIRQECEEVVEGLVSEYSEGRNTAKHWIPTPDPRPKPDVHRLIPECDTLACATVTGFTPCVGSSLSRSESSEVCVSCYG